MKYKLVQERGAVRFKANSAVRWLIDEATAGRKADMNGVWRAHYDGKITRADLRQFYRLIGYSVSGYGDIFPRAKSTEDADAQVAAGDFEQVRK